MSRKDALLRLHARLVSQRNDLRQKISDDLGMAYSSDSIRDVGEEANQVEQSEIHTQLAQLETRELYQIERSIQLIKAGRYGLCEQCDKPIPIARLQALPFTIYCVNCQRDIETRTKNGEDFEANWAGAWDYARRQTDSSDLSLEDLEQVEE